MLWKWGFPCAHRMSFGVALAGCEGGSCFQLHKTMEDFSPSPLALYHTLELYISFFRLQIVFLNISSFRLLVHATIYLVVMADLLIVKDKYIYIYIGKYTMNYIKLLCDRDDCCYKTTASDNYVIESSK